MAKPNIPLRAYGNYDTNAASAACQLICRDESRTQQHHAADADINVIVKRYSATGILPAGALDPLYGDFTQALDFHDAQNRIRAAQEAFMRIPPEIRSRFDNDPGKFVAFASDEANREELVRLKLVNPPPVVKQAAEPSEKPAAGSNGSADPTPKG